MNLREQSAVTKLIWAVLIVAALLSLVAGRWLLAFVSVATLVLSLLPALAVERFDIRLPHSFIALIAAFVFATIFLGEAFDFYERYWWWDIAMHGISSIGLGLIGFLFIFMLFEGDRYAAPPIALAFFGFCFAVAMGAAWEVFEFTVDQLFGTNMQKTGLPDTMGDLIVNFVGATIGAGTGFLYLKRLEIVALTTMLRQFIRENRRFFRKSDGPD